MKSVSLVFATIGALLVGCAASSTTSDTGAQGVGGENESPGVQVGPDGGTTGDPAASSSSSGGEPPAQQDGGVPPTQKDGGTTTTPPPMGGAGIFLTVNGQTYADPKARARRDKVLSGPGAGTFNGVMVVPTSQELLSKPYFLTFGLNVGGNGAAHAGTYPCSIQKGRQMPIGNAHVDILFPTPEGWVARDGNCFVNVASAGATGPNGEWHIVGTVGGKLLSGDDKTTEAALTGTFDLVYEN